MNDQIFRGGVPTEVDVIAIGRKWPSLKVGDRVGYDDIAALIGVEHGSARLAPARQGTRSVIAR